MIRVTSVAYILAGLLAAVVGILDGARVGAIYVMAGKGLEFQVITTAVIGGTPLSGGKGTILGSLLGVVLIAMLTKVLNLSGVNMYRHHVFVGMILIAVVTIDSLIVPKESRAVRGAGPQLAAPLLDRRQNRRGCSWPPSTPAWFLRSTRLSMRESR